jgi:hypothetical protein
VRSSAERIPATQNSVRIDLTLVFLSLSLVAFTILGAPAIAISQTPALSKPVPPPTTAAAATAVAKTDRNRLPTGTIKGRLVADDGQPLINANVRAQSFGTAPFAKPASVDSEGRFVFADLPAAPYLILANAPGYIDEFTTRGDPGQWPHYLIGSDVTINMIRGGVITGTVTNAKGEPIVGLPVHANPADGLPSSWTNLFMGGGTSETDDRGVYRIYGLRPGQYIVNTGGTSSFGQFGVKGFDYDVPTYYPSAARDTAVPVSVRGGDVTSGIDIKYKGSAGHSISGLLVGASTAGARLGAITVFLSHAGMNSVLGMAIVPSTDSRRTFSLNGIADGEYDLTAAFFSGLAENALAGSKRVSVRGEDLAGVEVRLASLASFAGTVTLEPIKPEAKCDKRGSQVNETFLSLPREAAATSRYKQTMLATFSGGLAMINEKGEFTLRNLEAGRYRLAMELPTASWYLQAVTLPRVGPQAAAPRAQPIRNSAAPTNESTQNGWQGMVTIKQSEQITGVMIVVGQNAAGLRGKLIPAREGMVIPAGTHVHLVPVDRDQANNILRYSETLVSTDGSFTLTNLAPGRYFILSRSETPDEVDSPAQPTAWDPVRRAALRRQAETANTVIELQPCQRIADYLLKPGG